MTEEKRLDERKCSGCMKWTPTSPEKFHEAEKLMYQVLKNDHETKFIEISNKNVIRTLKVGNHDDKTHPPLLMIHGFAAGSGFWMWNLDALSKTRNVYAIDLLGFARSSRPAFPDVSEEVDELFIQSIEDWRRQMRLEKIIILGHSFGGYISSIYSIKYPDRVLHLILDDPWGFPQIPEPGTGIFENIPKWKIRLFKILTSFNPLSALRAAGPWGPSLVGRLRSDIVAKYDPLYSNEENSPIAHYIFHCNAQKPSGETAFQTVSDKMVFAKNPLIHRFKDQFPNNKPVTIITGGDSWVNGISDFQSVQDILSDKQLTVYFVEDAGHHVHADQPNIFNKMVDSICTKTQTEYAKTFGRLETSI